MPRTARQGYTSKVAVAQAQADLANQEVERSTEWVEEEGARFAHWAQEAEKEP